MERVRSTKTLLRVPRARIWIWSPREGKVDGAITFGMNCIVTAGVEHLLKVGQTVGGSLRFD